MKAGVRAMRVFFNVEAADVVFFALVTRVARLGVRECPRGVAWTWTAGLGDVGMREELSCEEAAVEVIVAFARDMRK